MLLLSGSVLRRVGEDARRRWGGGEAGGTGERGRSGTRRIKWCCFMLSASPWGSVVPTVRWNKFWCVLEVLCFSCVISCLFCFRLFSSLTMTFALRCSCATTHHRHRRIYRPRAILSPRHPPFLTRDHCFTPTWRAKRKQQRSETFASARELSGASLLRQCRADMCHALPTKTCSPLGVCFCLRSLSLQ